MKAPCVSHALAGPRHVGEGPVDRPEREGRRRGREGSPRPDRSAQSQCQWGATASRGLLITKRLRRERLPSAHSGGFWELWTFWVLSCLSSAERLAVKVS